MRDIQLYSVAVIDTCVLMDALLMNFIQTLTDSKSVKEYEEILYVHNDNVIFKKNYRKFLENIKTFVTTSQVIGELQGLVNSRLRPKLKGYKAEFWNLSYKYLFYKQLDEQLINMLSVCMDNNYKSVINNIGYVDAGLIELAKAKKLPIISNDERTLAFAAQGIVDVFIPNQLLL